MALGKHGAGSDGELHVEGIRSNQRSWAQWSPLFLPENMKIGWSWYVPQFPPFSAHCFEMALRQCLQLAEPG